MKKKFLNSSIELLKKNGNYSDDELEVIVYGLEGLYLTFTKLIVIFAIAYLLRIWKEVIFLLISYNIIRTQAFGIHASKSIYCLISSMIMFVGGAIICKYINLPVSIMIFISIICNVCLFLYAPADTHKRPIVNQRKRKRFKYCSTIFGIIYTIIIIILKKGTLVNFLLFGMLEAVLMILPVTYNIFKMPYNNYKKYCSNV